MPVIKSAKKALRRDQKRAFVNQRIRRLIKQTLKKARKNPTKKVIAQTASILDRAAKKRVIHPNKAARLKSRLAKLAKKNRQASG